MKVYFIGIGGIGTSALAYYYHYHYQAEIQGSDLQESEIVSLLRKKTGAVIYLGQHKSSRISPDIDLVIYSPAVSSRNPELKKARQLRIRTLSYPQALGEITKNYYTICIAGTHGKSSSTAMAALTLIEAGFDPTVFLGTKLKEFGNTNFRLGKKKVKSLPVLKQKVLLLEADEWGKSFLNYFPDAILITNIDLEHLDIYKNLEELRTAFKNFVRRLPRKGILVYNKDNISLKELDPPLLSEIKGYSLKDKIATEVKKNLSLAGSHNLSNAIGVFTLAHSLGIEKKKILAGISKYQGAWRRFEEEKIALAGGEEIIWIDDYAHHPTEIKATLQGAREKFGARAFLWAIFQPHQISRTLYLFSKFKQAFNLAYKLIITDIFEVAGRDKKLPDAKRQKLARSLAEAIQKEFSRKKSKSKEALYLEKPEQIGAYLKKNLKDQDIVLALGAGNIYQLKSLWKEKYSRL